MKRLASTALSMRRSSSRRHMRSRWSSIGSARRRSSHLVKGGGVISIANCKTGGSVMETSTAFKGSRDVSEERLKVCRMLLEMDPEYAESYGTEIKDILRRLMIQKRIR